ncbi:hypothetical protein UMNF18_5334 [Escherichia coli UMNF18]|uniref:Uncharacterized protein n=2 Tax=Enterobacteriaceae TaxID=543 RepID=A0A828U0V9_ECOLX|nr:hypothetical protein SeHA_C4701 [Salmonella enterica subsp. enterica serovar Heidelberg str. SL476]AEJ59762.1 hypothetical protein UMNF18_5334 [Escherichia coli UMNF18]AGS27660.1 hypothetical protein SN31241_6860 [Salmonella enterica subsp. enterica serovar Newport str. USMARC-S3124.1]AKK51239.1 hypothetical protein PPECC33_04751 [Escherichia coli PCN033]AOM43091.1 hypothetical protein FORC28_0099 [Escherichia coli]EEJ48235.1 hypothetical protein HMPREF0358_1835 [Escherichia coli 83972]EFJ
MVNCLLPVQIKQSVSLTGSYHYRYFITLQYNSFIFIAIY